jgi:2'-5' RNA ligase
LTLKFLGETDDDLLIGLRESLKFEASAFKMTVQGFGTFNKGLIWAGIKYCPKLMLLQETISAQTCPILNKKLPKKTFFPHITVGRIKKTPEKEIKELIKNKAQKDVLGSFLVTQFGLYQSILKPSGAKHILVESFPLITRTVKDRSR